MGCVWVISVLRSVFQACTLARRNADVFLKYMHRNSVSMPGMLSHVKAPEQQVKSESLPTALRQNAPDNDSEMSH